MNLKFLWVCVAVFLVMPGGSMAYQVHAPKIFCENFEIFHEKFITDSTFQMSRIQFPLKGLPAGADKVHFENGYYWTKENWDIHIKTDYEAEGYKLELITRPSYVTETLVHPDGFALERRFMRMENHKWYLIYYAAPNSYKRH